MALDLSIVSAAIDALSGPVPRIRYSVSGWQDDGTYDPEANEPHVVPPDTVTIQATVQPQRRTNLDTGLAAKINPEGIEIDSEVVIWTRADLRADDEDTGLPADRFVFKGRIYVVSSIADRRSEGGFIRAIGRLESGRERAVR